MSSTSTGTSVVSKESTVLTRRQEILKVTQELMEAINVGNFDSYSKLCDPKMTIFEPESMGNLIEGVEYERFYFDHVLASKTRAVKMQFLNPNVRLLGDEGASISYVILRQTTNADGAVIANQTEETRVWLKKGNWWTNVHLHRSAVMNEFVL